MDQLSEGIGRVGTEKVAVLEDLQRAQREEAALTTRVGEGWAGRRGGADVSSSGSRRGVHRRCRPWAAWRRLRVHACLPACLTRACLPMQMAKLLGDQRTCERALAEALEAAEAVRSRTTCSCVVQRYSAGWLGPFGRAAAAQSYLD